MNARLMFRMLAPVVAISLLLLSVGVGAAWYIQRWQQTLAHDIRVNVSGVRAAEELEILVRETRTRLDHFLITGDSRYLDQVRELRADTERWLNEADRWGITPHEQQLVMRARLGEQRFWDDLDRLPQQTPDQQATGVRHLIDDVLVPEILVPTHAYLDLNEEEVEEAIDHSQVFAGRLVYALLFLATCGSAAGLVAGFGFARGLNRSLIQISVLIRDAAGRLNAGVGPLTCCRGDLGELENVLRLITDRVGAIVERLQQKEHEAIRAEQLAAVGQLAAGMAHELRNPLTSMKILVQGAMHGSADRGDGWTGSRLSSRDLTILEEEITRLEQLVQTFFDFARPPAPEKRMLDVRPLVEQTLAFLAGRVAAVSARVELAAPATPVCAAIDPGQFRQVLLNLVLNALDAQAGGTITVSLTEEPAGWVTLQVADNGCGLPAALGDRIFDPFTTTRETGVGLGLSICKRIATAHGGTLTAANRPEGGAIFTLRLPVTASVPQEERNGTRMNADGADQRGSERRSLS